MDHGALEAELGGLVAREDEVEVAVAGESEPGRSMVEASPLALN